MSAPMQTFGQRLQQLRRARGWSANELAKRASVTAPAVSFWESDQRAISPVELVRLARLLEVSPRFLDTGERADQPPYEILRWASRTSLTDLAKLHNAMRSGASQQQLLSMIGASHG